MDNTVISKLQKLINHEKSARTVGNIHEAEAFAAKIAEMLFAHKLSMSEVEVAAEDRDEPVNQENVDGLRAPWAATLAVGVCAASFCQVLQSSIGYVFIGRPNDRQAAVSMFRYLAVLGTSIAASELKAYKKTDDYAYRSMGGTSPARLWKASFLRGYAHAVHDRLLREVKTLTAQAQSAGSSLVFINKSAQALDTFMEKEFPDIRKGRTVTARVHGGAYGLGQQHGSRVSLKGQGQLGS